MSQKTRKKTSKILPVVDLRYPVDYSKKETLPNYKCDNCGATGCKLWTESGAYVEQRRLLCAKCAAKDQKKDISDIDAQGMRSLDDGGRTDQIGWYIPAVPKEENNDIYWAYMHIPQAGGDWWENLPTLP